MILDAAFLASKKEGSKEGYRAPVYSASCG